MPELPDASVGNGTDAGRRLTDDRFQGLSRRRIRGPVDPVAWGWGGQLLPRAEMVPTVSLLLLMLTARQRGGDELPWAFASFADLPRGEA